MENIWFWQCLFSGLLCGHKYCERTNVPRYPLHVVCNPSLKQFHHLCRKMIYCFTNNNSHNLHRVNKKKSPKKMRTKVREFEIVLQMQCRWFIKCNSSMQLFISRVLFKYCWVISIVVGQATILNNNNNLWYNSLKIFFSINWEG